MKNILIVGAGGFLGSIGRYLISKLNFYWDFHSIPIGTLIVNILGSLIIGFLTGLADKSEVLLLEMRLFLMVGFVGGFTTFSSFSSENLILFQNGQFLTVLAYTSASVFLGFLAVYSGYTLSQLL